MARRITEEERALAYFKTAPEEGCRRALAIIEAVMDVRFHSEAPKRRGRPVKTRAPQPVLVEAAK